MAKLFKTHRPKPARTGKGARPRAPRDVPKAETAEAKPLTETRPKEIGGPSGPEPTRYGDWERKGICVDF